MIDDSQRKIALDLLLREYERVAILGGPRTGKSTLANSVLDRPVIRTDDLLHVPWEDIPGLLLEQCTGLGRYLIEGVQIARALRFGLVVDAILYLDEPRAAQSNGQRSMCKAVATIFADWRVNNPETHVVSPDRS
jgi:hypothetical protein